MTLLLLIRHARSTWNAAGRMQGQADPPLDEIGMQQAHTLGEFLRSETLHAIYTSPLVRARATAEAIARYHTAPLILDARLMERHLGEWTGLTGDEAKERYPEWLGRSWRSLGAPGGESQAALTARVQAALTDILAAHPDETVAVVSHGGTLSSYLIHVLDFSLDQQISLGFENTAFARLSVRGAHVRLLSLGAAPLERAPIENPDFKSCGSL